ncbi:uncharacterized protein LOC128545989 [Mercenaria mercenaria]|uniref:uncharacterized protein LOC128545989 n=1 Tax=Mercenaria mercenaria TaxID=6596 RepID=UPI00234F30D4|nr:uncharacterized protein LOC128545989 [Mercenaria mercenaria]
MAMATRRSINKDENFYKRVLNRSHQRFLEDLDPVSVLDLFLEKNYLLYTQVRDIQEQRLTSDKTREIIKKVGSKGVQGYKTFKEVLRESHQEHLAEFLDKQERILEREIQMAEREIGRQARVQQLVAPAQTGNKRIPGDKELVSISEHIGMNWEMLGPFLGVPTPTIDQIKLDNPRTRLQIFRLFYVWRGMRGSDATVENLLAQMKMAPSAVNINWDAVNETVKRYGSEESVVLGGADKYESGKVWGKNEIPTHQPIVQKFGVGTGLTYGEIHFDNAVVKEIEFHSEMEIDSNKLTTTLYKQYHIKSNDVNVRFSDLGDSGALVFMKDHFDQEGDLRCIGMLEGVWNDNTCVVTPITAILEELKVTQLKSFIPIVTWKKIDERLREMEERLMRAITRGNTNEQSPSQ